jgi:YVTN family beta-propeller protein
MAFAVPARIEEDSVIGTRMVAAVGTVALSLTLAAGGTSLASTGQALRPAATAGPGTADPLIALVLAAGSANPLYATSTIGSAVTIPDGALEAAFTPDGQTAYVIGGDHVTPISVSDGVVAEPSIALPHSKYGADAVAVAITPNGKTALVVNNFAPYWVSWISTSTSKVVAKVKVGISPISIAITANGKYAYVTNVDSGTVTAISIAGHRKLRTVHVGFDPEAIAITPSGKYVYVADNGSSEVTPIRVAGNTALKPIKVGKFPAAIAISPSGKYAWVTNNGSGTVSKISLSSRKVVKTIRTARFPDNIVITSNGKDAYVASFDGQAINRHLHTVTAINLSSGSTKQIGVGKGPIALGYSPVTNTVYVSDFYSSTVTPIDVATSTAGPAISLNGQNDPGYIAIDPAP